MCTDIDGGDTFRNEILANVRDAKVFLIFLNEKWAKSDECFFEFNYAMRKNLTKKSPVIMPVVTENFDMEKYPHVDALIANVQGVFLTSCPSEDQGIKTVMESLKATVPIKAAAPAQDKAKAPPKPKAAPAKVSAAEVKELSSVMKSLTTKDNSLPSGKWQGYFIDNRTLHGKASGSKWLIDVTMNFKNNNEFAATGNDDVGPFSFKNGQIKGSKVEFLKAYARHNVCYAGEVRGVQMTGRWWLETASHIKGVWAMWPVS